MMMMMQWAWLFPRPFPFLFLPNNLDRDIAPVRDPILLELWSWTKNKVKDIKYLGFYIVSQQVLDVQNSLRYLLHNTCNVVGGGAEVERCFNFSFSSASDWDNAMAS